MDRFKEQFLATTYTVSGAHQRLSLLRSVLESVFFTTDTSDTVVTRYNAVVEAMSPADRARLGELDTTILSHLTAATLSAALKEWHTWLETLPTLTLYVPVVFEESQVVLLGRWCRAEVAQSVLLELIVEPAVVGGCAVIAHDTYHDLSLRARLAERPTALPAIIATYESA